MQHALACVQAIAMQETYEEEDDRDEAAEDALEAQAARQHFANAPRSFWADRLTATGQQLPICHCLRHESDRQRASCFLLLPATLTC